MGELGKLTGRATKSKPDFVVRRPDGSVGVVEAKCGTSNLAPAQKELKRQLGDDAFTVSRTSYDDVGKVGGHVGAVTGGAAGNCAMGSSGPC